MTEQHDHDHAKTVTDESNHLILHNPDHHKIVTSSVVLVPTESKLQTLDLINDAQKGHDLIEAALTHVKTLASRLERGAGGRETALTITKLEEARHRAVDTVLELQRLVY